MLNEFYDFIAKKINSYFQTAASEGALLKGESFCLKLDDEEMVVKVSNALRSLAESNLSLGEFSYLCRDGYEYKTFTLKVMDDEVIIAAQIDGMTNDFLCATLRNVANEKQIPLLMISANLIDSAKSGSRDLSASGMPFHSNELMREIREMVDSSTQLTDTEKRILRFELNRRDSDVFSDKASIYEYSDLLAIMSSGKIDDRSFAGFRLFPIDGKTEYQNYGSSQIDKLIKENNALFEKIDRGTRFGDLEVTLSKNFEESFIVRIEKSQKEHQDDWSRFFTYAELLDAMQKKQAKMENPLKIENENISVYGDLPLNVIALDKEFIIRNEGSQTAKKRTRNLFIFNSNHYNKIYLQVACNAKIPNNGIAKDDAEFIKEGKKVIFEFDGDGVSFHEVSIHDLSNDIKYVFKICIAEISAEYMYSTLKHSFSLELKKARKNSRVKLAGVGTTLVFNPNGADIVSLGLEDNKVYNCSIGHRLIICSTEEELANFGSGIKIDINFAGLTIPFILYPDESKSVEITGRKILRDKLASKKSFQYDDGSILSDSQEYFVKANLLRELRVECMIIEHKYVCCSCKNYYQSDSVKLEARELKLSGKLLLAYTNFIESLRSKNTIPTLAYLGDEEIYTAAQEYVAAFEECYANLQDGSNLSTEQEDALYLGTIAVGKNNDEILLTPFHPLNIMYQLVLLNEQGIEYSSDIVVDRLNSVNLLPYIQRNKKIYKVSDQLFSQETSYEKSSLN